MNTKADVCVVDIALSDGTITQRFSSREFLRRVRNAAGHTSYAQVRRRERERKQMAKTK